MFNHCPFLLRVSFRALTGAALLSLLPPLAHSQVDTAWVRRYRGPGRTSNGTALALDSRRNALYVVGITLPDSNSRRNFDLTLVKYNSAGDTLWVQRYNGPADTEDVAWAVVVDPRGNVYVTGSSWWNLSDWEDYATIKYDGAGNQKWIARYDGPDHAQDFPSAIAVDVLGNVYVTGMINGSVNEDYGTVKYDSLGNQLWVRIYNGPGNGLDFGNAICVDVRGNVYVTGTSWGSGTNYDIATIKYNSAGDTLWIRRYGAPWSDGGKAVAVDSSGNVFVSGWSAGAGSDFITIKYDSLGDTLWMRRYDGPAHRDDIVFDMALDFFGNVYVTGYSFGVSDSADYLTIKYDRNGNQRWVARYDGPAHNWDIARHIALDAQRNVYVAGGSIGLSDPYGDYCTVKYDSLGSQLWAARYNGPVNYYDDIYGLGVDDSSNVYITGTSDMYFAPVMYTIKYRQFLGVEELTPSGVPLHFELSQNVPNPWVSGTRIFYTLPHEDQVVLGVYNPMGQLVRTLLNGKESGGYKQVAWDGRDNSGRKVPSGVYFYRLQAGAFSDTKKMVLIR